MKTRRWFSLSFLLSFAIPFAFAAPPPAPAPAPDQPPREQSIYVPYEKLWQVFEKTGRGVFLPYEEFMRLWTAAEARTPRPAVVEPPVAALVAGLSADATVSKDVVTVAAIVDLEVLKAGWHRIPLRLGDVAVTSATLDGAPARLAREGDGYTLLVSHTNAQPRALQLRLEFAKAYEKSPGRNRVAFETPPAPISRWSVRIPEPGVKVEIQPLLAATDAPEAAATETRVLAFVGATPNVRLDWTPKAEGAKGLQALANVKAEHLVGIEEGVTRSRVRLLYEVSRAEIPQLAVQVPAGHKVVNVFDANVREWSVAATGGVQTIVAQLFEPTKAAQALIVELEQFSDQAQVAVPVVRAMGVTRQQGVIVVKLGGGLRGEATLREGLLQLDARELPAALARDAWNFSYRYAALPFDLRIAVEKVQPRVLVDALVAASIQPEELALRVTALCDVRRAGVFQFEWDIPADMEVRQIAGLAYAGADAARVDRHHLAPAAGADGMRRLTIALSHKAEGRVGLALDLRQPLREADLLTPTGKSVAIPLRIPRAKGAAIERDAGRLVVFGPESLRLNPSDAKGLRSVTYAEATQDMPPPEPRAGARPVLSFAYGDQAASLALTAERRAPHATVRQLLVARIESGVVKYEATFFYDVLYSGVKSLRLDLPADTAAKARVVTPGIRHAPLDAAGLADLAAGAVAWRVEGEAEFFGAAQFRVQWEEKIEKLDIGKTVSLAVPRLSPRGVDRAWGQVALAKAETIDVVPGVPLAGLRAIDPTYDLMPGADVKDAAGAFEFHGDWDLTVDVTRYEPKDVKATSLERGLVRMVVTRGDATSVQALYRLRSARQRLVIRLPGGVQFDTQPLRIGGRAVSLEQGAGGEYFVPLVGQRQDEPFLLELRYVVTGAGLRLAIPEFPQEPAVQRVYLSAYLPSERVYLGMRGDWNPEMVWVLRGFSTWPRGNKSSDELLRWVSEGLNADQGALKTFATDGRHLLYSTLRPAPGVAGSLRVVAMRGWVFQTLLVALLAALGLALLPVRAGPRLVAIGAGLSLLALIAVFAPSAARAIANNATAAAAFIVAVVWLLWFLLVTLPNSPGWRAYRESRRAAREAWRRGPPPLKKRKTEDGTRNEPEEGKRKTEDGTRNEPDATDPKAGGGK